MPLTNQYISSSYQGLIKLADSSQGLQQAHQPLTDGVGQPLPISVSITGLTITGSFSGQGSGLDDWLGLTEFAEYTSSTNERLNTIEQSTGIDTGSLVQSSTFQTYTGSNDLRVQNLEQATSSLAEDINNRLLISTFTGRTSEVDLKLNALEQTTSSLQQADLTFVTTSSFNDYTSSHLIRTTNLEQLTGSLATTGSNIFKADQEVDANLIIRGNLYVSGSETILSSSQLYVGDRIIELNANRTIGDCGIYVHDTIAPTGTGSLLWDATTNYWKGGFVGSELRFLNTDDLGNVLSTQSFEQYTSSTNLKLSSIEQSTSSLGLELDTKLATSSFQTYTGSANIRLTNVEAHTQSINTWTSSVVLAEQTGSMTVATASYVDFSNVDNKPTLVSGSSQITYSGLTGIPDNIISGSGQVQYSGLTGVPEGLISGSSQVQYSGLTDVPSGIISGSSQVVYSGLTGVPEGLISGSSQVQYSGLTGVPDNIISGSSQVVYSGLTGVPTNIISGSAQISALGYSTTSSFNTYTQSTDLRLTSIESATASLQLSVNSKLNTSSFNSFTGSYTTGSFTGSFTGDGSGLTGIYTYGTADPDPLVGEIGDLYFKHA